MSKGNLRLFINCVTAQYYPETKNNIVLTMQAIGFQQIFLEEQLCCGWVYNCTGNFNESLNAHQAIASQLSQAGLDLYFLEQRCFGAYQEPLIDNKQNEIKTTYVSAKLINFNISKFFAFNNIKVNAVSSCFGVDFLKQIFLHTEGLSLHFQNFGFCCGANNLDTALKLDYNDLIFSLIESAILNINGVKLFVFEDDFCRARFAEAIKHKNFDFRVELMHWADLIVTYGNSK